MQNESYSLEEISIEEKIRKILKGNRSAVFKEMLEEKKMKRKKTVLTSLFKRRCVGIATEKERIPSNLKQIIHHLVHFFFHGSLPFDKTEKSSEELRNEEREVMKDLKPAMNFHVILFRKDVPKDIFFEILSYIPHNYQNLCSIGLTNELFYISFLMTWETITITPANMKKISILVLNHVHHISLVQDDLDEDKSSKIFQKKNLEYLFSNLTIQRIRSIDLSKCKNMLSYQNFFKEIVSRGIVFNGLSKIIFQDTKYLRNLELSFRRSECGDAREIETRRDSMKFYSSQNILNDDDDDSTIDCVHPFPNIRVVQNAIFEEMGFFDLSQSKIQRFGILLFKNDLKRNEAFPSLMLRECSHLQMKVKDDLPVNQHSRRNSVDYLVPTLRKIFSDNNFSTLKTLELLIVHFDNLLSLDMKGLVSQCHSLEDVIVDADELTSIRFRSETTQWHEIFDRKLRRFTLKNFELRGYVPPLFQVLCEVFVAEFCSKYLSVLWRAPNNYYDFGVYAQILNKNSDKTILMYGENLKFTYFSNKNNRKEGKELRIEIEICEDYIEVNQYYFIHCAIRRWAIENLYGEENDLRFRISCELKRGKYEKSKMMKYDEQIRMLDGFLSIMLKLRKREENSFGSIINGFRKEWIISASDLDTTKSVPFDDMFSYGNFVVKKSIT